MKNLHPIAEVTCKITVNQQVIVFPRQRAGNLDQHITDLSIEHPPIAGLDRHSAVANEDFTVNPVQLRPARLERQGGVMHFEIQADAACGVDGIVVQRTLVLEIALLNRATQDCGSQPLVQRRAQHRGQVLAGITTVTIEHADPQVHVVFQGRAVKVQADQEVAGDFAVVPLDFDVRRDQGEALLVELPGQARIGLLVTPRLGEDRVQMQHEIRGIQAQFALPQVAADAAADIPGCRRPVIGVEADLVEVGVKTQTLVTHRLRSVVDQHVAQAAGRFQMVEHHHDPVRQRRQGIEHWRDRRQVDAIGLHVPQLVSVAGRGLLLELGMAFPALASDVHRQ